MSKLDDVLQDVRMALGPELVMMSVLGLDGIPIGGFSAVPMIDYEFGCANGALMAKLSSKMAEELDLGPVEDLLSTTEHALVMMRLLGDGSYAWGLAFVKEATLGKVRVVMNEFAERLWEAIPR